jgi:hypothetical protein
LGLTKPFPQLLKGNTMAKEKRHYKPCVVASMKKEAAKKEVLVRDGHTKPKAK